MAAIVVGWALAQNPYLLPGRAHARAGGGATTRCCRRVVIVVGVGMLILGPSLWWLYRLVLQGRLDQELRAARPALPPMKVAAGSCSAAWSWAWSLMLGVRSWLTRLLGVLALFAFIVTGVFLIADPAFLAEEDEG